MRWLVFFVVACAGESEEPWDEDDFYTLLGIDQEANLGAIKRAYRKLSLEHHPDSTGTGEVDTFQKLSRAYEVLSDKNLRRIYDQEGLEGVEQHEKRKAAGEQRMHDPYSSLFGQRNQRDPKKSSIHIPLFVSMKDVYIGKSFQASFFRQTRCKKCRGTGARTKKDIHTCPHCQGRGIIVGVHHVGRGFYQQIRQQCPHCQGKGKTVLRTCNHCHGTKVVQGLDHLDVILEHGMPEGHTIGFENMCDEIAGSSEAPGDVNFKVQTTTLSSALSREGNDLRLQISITLQESLVGFKKEVLHLDGHIVELNRTGKVTSHGLIERIEGEGMPIHERPSEFGDLIVVYSVGFPDTLTDPQKDVLQSVLD